MEKSRDESRRSRFMTPAIESRTKFKDGKIIERE